MKIGIGITTRDRREMAEATISQWRYFMPEDAKLVIVDDDSKEPYPDADYRFEQQAGIAVAKNKCLELLEDCDHIFLVDDDINPVRKDWWRIYVDSGLNHAMYIFERRIFYKEPTYTSYELPRGCMLYFKKICLEVVGGMDPFFKIWGFEHANLSRRIHNAGLIPAPFIDVPNSYMMFWSRDEAGIQQSSVSTKQRLENMHQNKGYYETTINSKEFIPYK